MFEKTLFKAKTHINWVILKYFCNPLFWKLSFYTIQWVSRINIYIYQLYQQPTALHQHPHLLRYLNIHPRTVFCKLTFKSECVCVCLCVFLLFLFIAINFLLIQTSQSHSEDAYRYFCLADIRNGEIYIHFSPQRFTGEQRIYILLYQ